MYGSPNDFLNHINKWFNGLIALPLLLGAWGYLEVYSGKISAILVLPDIMNYAILVLIVITTLVFIWLYKKKIGQELGVGTLENKLELYFAFSKTFYVQMFAVSALSVAFLFLNADTAFAGVYAFQLFTLSVFRPSLLSVANKLGLKGQERTRFLTKNSF